jgi:peptidoglycan/xylan/chitin deacetylase (PgdA/CDA1 family)
MMGIRPVVSKLLWSLLAKPTFQRALRLYYGGRGSILMLHRVVPKEQLSPIDQNRRLEITPAELEALIQWALDQNFEVVSLDVLCQRLSGARVGPKLLSFTFDDGYRDNFEYAFPIFKKYKIPMAIFVTTGLPDFTLNVWWYALEELLLCSTALDFEHRGNRYQFDLGTMDQKNFAFSEIKKVILSCSAPQVDELLRNAGFDDDRFSTLSKRLVVSWENLREMVNDSSVTLGAHTVSHPRLSLLSDCEIAIELGASAARIEEQTKKKIQYFAYPFGDAGSCGKREFQAAARAGFKAAVTSRQGNIASGHRAHMYCLPRQAVGGADFSILDLALRMSGYPLLRSHHLSNLVTD